MAPEVAERLVTTERFPRRLIEERRVEFIRLGRHVRIAESVLAAYVGAARGIRAVSPAPARPRPRS
jgi:excisionase family DNA binding protein